MIAPCIWCDGIARYRQPPPPEGFCSNICAARYRGACAHLGAELHREGAVSIGNLRARFAEIASASPPLIDGYKIARTLDAVAVILVGCVIAAIAHFTFQLVI